MRTGRAAGTLVALALMALGAAPGTASALTAPVCSPAAPLEVRTDLPQQVSPACGQGEMLPASLTLVDPPDHGAIGFGLMSGVYTYYPADGYRGPDRFEYAAVNDLGHSDVVVQDVTVSDEANHAPSCFSLTQTLRMRTDETVSASAGCFDPDGDTVTRRVIGTPAHVLAGPWWTDPRPFHPGGLNLTALSPGDERLSYTGSDGRLDAPAATIPLHVADTVGNSAPVCDVQSVSGAGGGMASPNCTDPEGDDVDVQIVTPPAHGTANLAQFGGGGPLLIYNAEHGFVGHDEVRLVASDGQAQSAPVTIGFDVTAAGAEQQCAAPAQDPVAVRQDGKRTIRPPFCRPVTLGQPEHGTVGFGSNGDWLYTPDAGYEGPDAFSYHGNAGPSRTQHLVVSADANAAPACPSIGGRPVPGKSGTAITVRVFCTDADQDALTLTPGAPPAHGIVGDADQAAGTVKYTSDAAFHGLDDLTVAVTDGHGGEATAGASVIVTDPGANNGPVCESMSMAVPSPTDVQYLSPPCRDTDGDTLTYTIVRAPEHGVLNISKPSWTFTRDPGWVGTDAFQVRATDGKATSRVATVTIALGSLGQMQPAVCQPVGSTVIRGSTRRVPMTCDGAQYTMKPVVVDAPQHGTLGAIKGARVAYTADGAFTGTDTFTYRGDDGAGHTTVPVTVTMDVVAALDPPAPAPAVAAPVADAGAAQGAGDPSPGLLPLGALPPARSHAPRAGWLLVAGMRLGTASAWMAPGLAKGTVRVPASGRADLLILECPDGCRGKAGVTLEPGAGVRGAAVRRLAVGGGALKIARGRTATVRLRLDRGARAALKRMREPRIRVTVTLGGHVGRLVLRARR